MGVKGWKSLIEHSHVLCHLILKITCKNDAGFDNGEFYNLEFYWQIGQGLVLSRGNVADILVKALESVNGSQPYSLSCMMIQFGSKSSSSRLLHFG